MREQVTEKILQVDTSGKFMAILDCLLNIKPRRTVPAIENMVITSDGRLLVQHYGDIGYNDYMAIESDLYNNLDGIAEATELTNEEWDWLIERADSLWR